MLRYSLAVVIALGFALPVVGQTPADAGWISDQPDSWEAEAVDVLPETMTEENEPGVPVHQAPTLAEPHEHWWPFGLLGLRHSQTHGRHIGRGQPLAGTSWRNRPYYVGGEIGTLWLTEPINDQISRDTDMFGGIFAGCDWDHYWGAELGIHRATPELINRNEPDADRGDRLMMYSASLLYYPWGDSRWRPYARWGIGGTEVDFPDDDGRRRDETLWTMPIGIGVKYPWRRWLAARAEFADRLAFGTDDIATQHNLSFTFGLEWHFGAKPRTYWPWNPDRHIW